MFLNLQKYMLLYKYYIGYVCHLFMRVFSQTLMGLKLNIIITY